MTTVVIEQADTKRRNSAVLEVSAVGHRDMSNTCILCILGCLLISSVEVLVEDGYGSSPNIFSTLNLNPAKLSTGRENIDPGCCLWPISILGDQLVFSRSTNDMEGHSDFRGQLASRSLLQELAS